MRLLRTIVGQILESLLVVCGVLGVLLPVSPLNMPLALRDSGAFLYIGWRILSGELPYRDIWDHKPPNVLYINALGLAISGDSRWGVWCIEFLALFVAAWIGFQLIKRVLGFYPAIFSLLIWLVSLVFVIQGGNLTTEYALPLQFAALRLVYDADRPNFSYWRWFLIGLLGGVAFFTKQTAIGIWIAIALYLTCHRLKRYQVGRWFRELLSISAGGLIVCAIWVLWFGSHGALSPFWNAAFRYNFAYISSPLTSRLTSIIAGAVPFTPAGLLEFAGIGFIIGAILLRFKKNAISGWSPLLVVALMDLPLELILISTSGRVYLHYYMTMLPILSFFAGLTFWLFLSLLSFWEIPNPIKGIFTMAVIGIFLWSSLPAYGNQVANFSKQGRDETPIRTINYIGFVTSPDDYVLVWGGEPFINYATERRSPSRFVYQFPLYTQGYVDEQMIIEFLGDLIRNRPRLIIDTREEFTPMYDFPIHTDAIETGVAYLKSHYRVVSHIGPWVIYEYAGATEPVQAGGFAFFQKKAYDTAGGRAFLPLCLSERKGER